MKRQTRGRPETTRNTLARRPGQAAKTARTVLNQPVKRRRDIAMGHVLNQPGLRAVTSGAPGGRTAGIGAAGLGQLQVTRGPRRGGKEMNSGRKATGVGRGTGTRAAEDGAPGLRVPGWRVLLRRLMAGHSGTMMTEPRTEERVRGALRDAGMRGSRDRRHLAEMAEVASSHGSTSRSMTGFARSAALWCGRESRIAPRFHQSRPQPPQN